MNNINKKLFYFIALGVIAFSASSCLDDLNVTPINPQVTQTFDQEAVFAKTYAAFALSGQEGAAGNNDIDITDEGRFSLTRCLWNCSELPTDEALCAWGDNEVVELNANTWPSTNLATEGLYARLYFIVTISNHFLEQTAGKTDAVSVKERAEVRYLRALSYYYLMDFFGNVPFSEKISDEFPPQIKRADLFTYIEKELTECEPDMYEPRQADKPYYRLDKAANWMLKARLYLNAEIYTGTQRWDDAITYSNKVMTSAYKLNPSYKQLFMADNAGSIDGSTINTAPQEIIFPIAADGVKTKSWGGALFLIASTHTNGMAAWGSTEGWGGNRARATLVKKFFPSGSVPTAADLTTAAVDDRAMMNSVDKTLDITKVTDFTKGISVAKYTNIRADGLASHDTQFPDMDIPFMRAAEAYLTYAEANLRSTAGSATLALKAVNDLRARAHAIPLTGLSKDQVLDEWAREFYFEGRRRTDLIRYGYFGGGNYNWDWKGGTAAGTSFPAKFNLMPLPPGDLNANPNLKQNPNY